MERSRLQRGDQAGSCSRLSMTAAERLTVGCQGVIRLSSAESPELPGTETILLPCLSIVQSLCLVLLQMVGDIAMEPLLPNCLEILICCSVSGMSRNSLSYCSAASARACWMLSLYLYDEAQTSATHQASAYMPARCKKGKAFHTSAL